MNTMECAKSFPCAMPGYSNPQPAGKRPARSNLTRHDPAGLPLTNIVIIWGLHCQPEGKHFCCTYIRLPRQHLKVSSDGGLIFLRGTVNDLHSSQRAFTIASTAG